MVDMFSEEEIESIKRKRLKIIVTPKLDVLENIKKFEIRNDDIFLLGCPKSGTTWTQEMVWLIANNLNFKGAEVYIDKRFPNLESGAFNMTPSNVVKHECHSNSLQFAENMKSPRCIKSHLELNLLPEQLLNCEKNPKIVYVARNIKDVCVSSYYHHLNLLKSFDGSIDEYAKIFTTATGILKNHWNTLLYFWNHRQDNRILFLRYEELKQDLKTVIQKVANFLEKKLTEENEAKLLHWLSLETMRNNAAVNHKTLYNTGEFIRVGKVGEHKKELSAEIIEKFDMWIKSNLKDSDYSNDYI